MKWVLIGKRHINMNNVDAFMWERGTLFVCYTADPEIAEFDDPDRKLYLKICLSQGVRPYEGDDNGQNVAD